MFSLQQVNHRLDQIEQFVKTLDPGSVNMNSWVSTLDDPDCGTVCCIMGWMAHEQLFGLKLDYPVWTTRDRIRGEVHPAPMINDYCGYNAAALVLFGNDIPNDHIEATLEIAEELFCPARGSVYDTPGDADQKYDQIYSDRPPYDTHVDVFLKRIPHAREAIRALY